MTPSIWQLLIVLIIVGGLGFGIYLIIKVINKK